MNLCWVRGRYWAAVSIQWLRCLGLPADAGCHETLTEMVAECGCLAAGRPPVFSGVQVQSYGSALLAVVVISLLNTLVRPFLVVLTLPVTVVTVGLFLFVINGLMLWAASGLLGGLHVSGFWAAVSGRDPLFAAGHGDRVTSRAPVPVTTPLPRAGAYPQSRASMWSPWPRRAKSCAALKRSMAAA